MVVQSSQVERRICLSFHISSAMAVAMLGAYPFPSAAVDLSDVVAHLGCTSSI